MSVINKYNKWIENAIDDNDLINELKLIKDKNNEIEDRFYRELEFGTGGLRGVIGAGTNRINIYTVRKATQGLADYLNSCNINNPKVAIAYDSRIKSDLFAKEAARVFAANKIKVYIYNELMPTPALSFALRQLKCDAGIVITASHNPSKYNGYKVYGSDGGQITLDMANAIYENISKIDIFNDISLMDFEVALNNKQIEYISSDVFVNYLLEISNNSILQDRTSKLLSIVYSPLNGTGRKGVTSILKIRGFNNLLVVKEQENPDGLFPTCPYPNPELLSTFDLAIKYGKKNNADILLLTDPDCDRVGVAVNHNNDYVVLNGNEIGILLFDFICKVKVKNKTMPYKPVVIKTIVTTDMLYPLANKYQVNVIDVLIGFKYIGEQIGLLEKKKRSKRFIFSFEESNGFLSYTGVRDKDGVNASLLIAEMGEYYRRQNINLIDQLNNLYNEFGYYKTSLLAFEKEGKEGLMFIKAVMEDLRTNNKLELDVDKTIDYSQGGLSLPKADIIKYVLKNGSTITLRPSGTEPKLKVYLCVIGDSIEKSESLTKEYEEIIKKYINSFTKHTY